MSRLLLVTCTPDTQTNRLAIPTKVEEIDAKLTQVVNLLLKHVAGSAASREPVVGAQAAEQSTSHALKPQTSAKLTFSDQFDARSRRSPGDRQCSARRSSSQSN